MFKNLKSLFVKEDEVQNTKSEQKDVKTPQSLPKNEDIVPDVKHERVEEFETEDLSGMNVEGEVSEKFMNILLGAINKHNQDGFDYIEFKQSLANLSAVEMDEKTKIQSAFAMAKTMNTSKARLIESANFYLGILNKESEKFGAAVSSQMTKQVGGKRDSLKNIELSIENKTKQIEQLTKEIEQLKIDQEKTSKVIGNSQVKVTKTKNDFQKTFEMLKGKILNDIDLIEKHTS